MQLVIIDAHAILHRAYHALPPLTNPHGVVINAVYGFTTMLLTILDSLKPTHLVTAFDRPEPNFRQQLYTAYQGKRPDLVGNFVEQIPMVKEMLDVLGVPRFEVVGYEADDVIGTLARQARGLSVVSGQLLVKKYKNESITNNQQLITEILIVTGDRDMLQLVNETTKVCFPVKGFAEYKIYDQKLMEEEFGVSPSQWVDVKALKGDASDNYSGVVGIGPKTAEKLINEYGTLERLYENLAKLDVKTAKKLAEGIEAAGLGKKLAQIVTDVPTVNLALEKAKVDQINWETGIKYMRGRLGFKTIVERIQNKYLKSAIQETSKDQSQKLKDQNKDLNQKTQKEAVSEQMKLI